MRATAFAVLSVAIAIFGSTSLFAQSPQSEITAVLTAQQEAWNRGDVDTFMNGY